MKRFGAPFKTLLKEIGTLFELTQEPAPDQ